MGFNTFQMVKRVNFFNEEKKRKEIEENLGDHFCDDGILPRI